jgi:hypothetical protein
MLSAAPTCCATWLSAASTFTHPHEVSFRAGVQTSELFAHAPGHRIERTWGMHRQSFHFHVELVEHATQRVSNVPSHLDNMDEHMSSRSHITHSLKCPQQCLAAPEETRHALVGQCRNKSVQGRRRLLPATHVSDRTCWCRSKHTWEDLASSCFRQSVHSADLSYLPAKCTRSCART